MAKSGGIRLSELWNPLSTVAKFGMGDYVGDITPQAKIQIDRHSPKWRRAG